MSEYADDAALRVCKFESIGFVFFYFVFGLKFMRFFCMINEMKQNLKNKFNLFEFSGAFGDIGILLPLAFAFVIFNGFAPRKLFLLWGLAYMVTGFYYRVPISIQPLKAMAVIAIASGFLPHQISSTAFFYGVIFLIISLTGVLRYLQPVFTPAVVRGIQVGIGLILIYKAVTMVFEKGLFLDRAADHPWANIGLMVLVTGFIWFFQFRKKFPLSIFIIFGSIILAMLSGVTISTGPVTGESLFRPALPDFSFFGTALVFLILPQLPLTIGNAVYAASDICRQLWKERAEKVSSKKLGISIGLINIVIGIFGGFPICHGSGGMAAHHQFGGKTGGTTIILGALLVVTALFTPLHQFIFYIPLPVLGALLFITGLKMALFIKNLKLSSEVITALLTAGISFFTRNLLIAVVVGFLAERLYVLFVRFRAQNN